MMKIHDLYDEVDLADEARHIREVHSKMPSTAGENAYIHGTTSNHGDGGGIGGGRGGGASPHSKFRKSSVTLTKVRPIITRPWRKAVVSCGFWKKLEKINVMLQCLTMLTIIGGTIGFLILYSKLNKIN